MIDRMQKIQTDGVDRDKERQSFITVRLVLVVAILPQPISTFSRGSLLDELILPSRP